MSSTDNSEPETETAQPEAAQTEKPPRGWLLTAVLGAVVLALVLVGVVFVIRAHQLRTSGPMANKAVVDKALTTQVSGEVTTALNQVLSYDYRQPQVAAQAAQTWLTGDAPAQYRELFAELQRLANGQKLTLVAKVNKVGVVSLTEHRAQLLVFVDQSSTRASDGESSVSAAQVQITAVRSGKTWKISELKPL